MTEGERKKKQPNAYALFIKEHYHDEAFQDIKKSSEKFKAIAQLWQARKKKTVASQ